MSIALAHTHIPEQKLLDGFDRTFTYLRLSLTDVCNFRCVYCLPHGLSGQRDSVDPLSVREVEHLVAGLSQVGMRKIRLTGGEPLVRKDLLEIVSAVRNISDVSNVSLSTNGYRLKPLVPKLKQLGLDAINISLDSLSPETFARTTGRPVLSSVLEGIDACIENNIESVKLNVVLLRGLNDQQLSGFLEFIKDRPVTVRFIEYMETGGNTDSFVQLRTPANTIENDVQRLGWQLSPRAHDAGPAREYRHKDYRGGIGFITPYSRDFCSSCNRLRVTARGELRLCLFANSGVSLRHLLRSGDQREELIAFVRSALKSKEVSHYLNARITGANTSFSQIGG